MFRSAEHEAQFERDGCVLVEGLGAQAIDEAEEVFRETSDTGHSGFHQSLSLVEADQRARIDALLDKLFDEPVSQILEGVTAVHAAFVSKGSDAQSVVEAHQDWSFVDERTHRSLSVWIPLCDTNAENGALAIVKGSQHVPHTIRGTDVPWTIHFDNYGALPYLTPFPMRAGDALFYDHRVLHASPANRSGRRRTAVAIGLVPTEATILHYVGSGDTPGTVREFEVDHAFFNRYHYGGAVDVQGYRSHEVAYEPVAIGPAELDALRPRRLGHDLRRAAARLRAWPARRSSPPARK